MRLTAMLILVSSLYGCSRTVRVIDTAGRPVAGASVYLEMEDHPLNAVEYKQPPTGSDGTVMVPRRIYGRSPVALRVWVFDSNLESQRVDVRQKWPDQIVLRPSSTD